MYSTLNVFITKDSDGFEVAHPVDHDCSADYFFREVSKVIAFDDCTDLKVTTIIWHGKRVRYDGWAPRMYFKYTTPRSHKTVWDGYFPEFDH